MNNTSLLERCLDAIQHTESKGYYAQIEPEEKAGLLKDLEAAIAEQCAKEIIHTIKALETT